MKTLLIVYRVLTFILLPIAAIFGFIDLSLLLMALANPAALLPVFAIACIVIYVFTSLSFLTKGIIGGRKCKPSLRDWIRVNAFVSIAFSALGIIEYITLINNKTVASEVIKQAMQHQTIPAGMSTAQLEQMLLSFLLFFFIFSVLLIIHIYMTFRLLKQFNYLFK
ncbi:hypothetical protein FC093_13715 [Ilyomonas limi]|uniref:Uncharacterized protein n=1 Tax=Ilyomonas limi TaxID=2575867 RepID=A0A4U3KYI8_9BACT|nr:hypothetical protein [Ilyomonas limi]TKK67801.1 hypothetical protein FC093_13715 [Ilyomonas limi]